MHTHTRTQETEASCTRAAAVQRVITSAIGAGLAIPAVVAVAPPQADARKPGVNKPVRVFVGYWEGVLALSGAGGRISLHALD